MKYTHASVVAALAVCGGLLLTGCAHVTFHPKMVGDSDLPDTGKKSGIKYYNAKPYLLVSYTGNKDAPVKVEFVSLPDLEHPVYAMYHSGLGSHQFTLSVASNGTLTSYGQTADTKIPETLTAVGNMVSSFATGLKTAGLVRQSAEEDLAVSKIEEAIGQLGIIETMDQQSPLVMGVAPKSKNAREVLDAILDKMKKGDFDHKKALEDVQKDLDAVHVDDAAGNPEAVAINSAFKGASAAMKAALGALAKRGSTGAAPKPDFLLFEIRSENGTTKLVLVQ